MIKIGITGQSGFIGTHLFNTLGLSPEKFIRVPFDDNYFQNPDLFERFVKECDVIVHLAAMNRHHDPEVIYKTNTGLVRQLIDVLEKTASVPHLHFASSTQEERENLYGKSKREGRELFEKWAARSNARFTGFVIPNVFGPFGKPYYNSVIATFCHQLTHNEIPQIEIDGEIKFIYVGELVKEIIERIELSANSESGENIVKLIRVPHTSEMKVSELLKLLQQFKTNYFEKGEIPSLNDKFELNLFNTLLTYFDHAAFFPFKFKSNTDPRGSFVELLKLKSGGQVSFSSTVPGVTRGNHFHTRKAERFMVIKGKAVIQLRRIGTSEVMNFELSGDEPSCVDMPVWFTHNITNSGKEDLYTVFWINEIYNSEDPDTFFEKV